MKTRKQKLQDYDDHFHKYFKNKNNELALIEQFFEENGYDLEKALEKGRERAIKILSKRIYKNIKITLYEAPFKTERGRVGVFKNIYSPNAADNHRYLEKKLLEQSERIESVMDILSNVITTPSEICVNAYFPVPKVKKKHAYEILLYITGILKVFRDPDYDNIAKAYTDMLNNTVIFDDKIFYKGVVNKYYAILPKVEIIVSYQEKHDSETLFENLGNTKMIKELVDKGLATLEFLE
jgi:Holliday junction resolvase RusA-like endonuclease